MTTPELGGTPQQDLLNYRTVSLSEVHYVGVRCRPVLHVVKQEIEAISACDKLTVYFDDRNVSHIAGSRGYHINNYRYASPYLSAADVILPETIEPGERSSIDLKYYWRQAFLYGHRTVSHPPECRRRIGSTPIESVTMAVSFETAPARVWATDWDDIYPSALMQEGTQTELEPGPPPETEERQDATWVEHHFEDCLPGRVFGIAWEWREQP